MLRPNGISVALIGCAPYDWAQSLLDVAGTAALVREAAARADVVVVYMHAGAEGNGAQHVADRAETYLGEPSGNPVAFAHAMVERRRRPRARLRPARAARAWSGTGAA